MKKIVVATDYSAEAENAMLYAAAIASDRKYELVLFSLQNISFHAKNARLTGDAFSEQLLKKQKKLEELGSKLETDYKISVIAHFATGDFYEELSRCIEMHEADLVVVGMAQKSVEQDLLGNTTTKILSELKLPVLAIPLSAKYKGIKNILFACDIVRGVHKKVLDDIKELSLDFNARVEVFHVTERINEWDDKKNVKENIEQVEKGLSGTSYYYKNVSSNEIIKAIKDEIELISADMLIMVPYKYGFWDAIVHRSKTRMMASGNNIPLLSIPL